MKEFYQLLLCYQRLGWFLPPEIRHSICQELLKKKIIDTFNGLHPIYTQRQQSFLYEYLNHCNVVISMPKHGNSTFIASLAVSLLLVRKKVRIVIICANLHKCKIMMRNYINELVYRRIILTRRNELMIGTETSLIQAECPYRRGKQKEYDVYLYDDVIPTEHHRDEFIISSTND